VRRLSAAEPSVSVTGGVPDVRPYLWGAAMAVAPLHIARGTQTKVLEALTAGLPVAVTSAVAGGLPAEALPGCLVADTPTQFAAAIVDCLTQSADQRRSWARRANISLLTWERQLGTLADTLEAAARSCRTERQFTFREAAAFQ